MYNYSHKNQNTYCMKEKEEEKKEAWIPTPPGERDGGLLPLIA